MSIIFGVLLLIASIIVGGIGIELSAEAFNDNEYPKSATVLFATVVCAGSLTFCGCGLLTRCSNCGKFYEHKLGSEYCSHCGQAFSLGCESCSRKVNSGDKYCAWCGADIQED